MEVEARRHLRLRHVNDVSCMLSSIRHVAEAMMEEEEDSEESSGGEKRRVRRIFRYRSEFGPRVYYI